MKVKSEVRNPKSERSSNPEIRTAGHVSWRIRISVFGLASDFGFRISDLSLLAAVALFLTGCAVGPNFNRPPTHAPAAFANAEGIVTTNAQFRADWWRTFNDSLLERFIAQASTNNYDLRRAQARLREARALWTAARFDFAPTVRSDARYEKFQLSEDAAGTRDRQSQLYRAGFDATWELDIWGNVRRNVEAARATVESVEATRDDVLILIQAEVAANYIGVRGTQLQLEVATRNATNQAQTLELAIALLNGGQGTQLDVARARSLLNETLASIPPLQASLQSAMYRIAVLCGVQPTALTNDLLATHAFPTIPAELALTSPTELLRNRPDIRAAERSLAAATARIGVETADLFPRVTFNGSLALGANSFGDLGSPASQAYSFGPRITWAAFDLGRVRQRIKAADARAEQALATYEQTVLLVLEETENVLVALSRERQRFAYLTEAERAAAEAVQLARQRYRDGIADYLSVLDSERTLLNLQEQLVTAQALTVTRLIAVYKALSGGVPVRSQFSIQ
jgi:multidrug efflux system outer membrane protein